MNSSSALVPDFFTPISRTSGSLRADKFWGLTKRYLKALSFLLSSSVKDTILTTLPNIIWVSSDDVDGVELTKCNAELWKVSIHIEVLKLILIISYLSKSFMNAWQQAWIEQVEEIEKQHTRKDCQKKCSIRDIDNFHILYNHSDCPTVLNSHLNLDHHRLLLFSAEDLSAMTSLISVH